MNSRIEVDRISVLPKNIIDSILTRLPILEAVRTSILSRSWRYQWHSLTKISIKSNDLLPDSQVVKIIDHVLSVHSGSVDKFELDINFLTCNDMDRWILYLSRNGIKELIINNLTSEFYSLPSCIYSCSDLKYLQLVNCKFKPPPATFKAFSSLTQLVFGRVEFTNMMLENLLILCPLLSTLGLLYTNRCPSLKINAPNLYYFHIVDFYGYFQFKNTPRLAYASFTLESPVSSHMAVSEDCKIVELLGSMPILERLKFHKFALQHLSIGNVPTCLPFLCPIEHLNMCINFEDLQELLAAFCIFRSSPFIQHLELRVFGDKDTSRISANGFWEGEHDFSFGFYELQKVRVTSFTGNENELEFIEFLLGAAPALKTMEINFSVDKDGKDLFPIFQKLVRFCRISPDAELILPTY